MMIISGFLRAVGLTQSMISSLAATAWHLILTESSLETSMPIHTLNHGISNEYYFFFGRRLHNVIFYVIGNLFRLDLTAKQLDLLLSTDLYFTISGSSTYVLATLDILNGDIRLMFN